ncbi:MAG TPA: UDP-N-acetylmuramoyl-L-alanine--D-glutamate ligase [Chloroflexota bacterium]|nr:UDP-N-acetylmuramoyl-L-alanine--D-glutamate ligase [Chloroflexota bacterium]
MSEPLETAHVRAQPPPVPAAGQVPRPPVDYSGAKVLVMGLGIFGGGAGVAKFLAQRGAAVTVTDLRGPEDLQSSIESLRGLDVRYVLGEHRAQDFVDVDFIVRNPAVPTTSRYLGIAREHGVPVYMEMSLFFMECWPDRVIGITGTKGKTTTTTLTGEILKHAGRDVVVAGNLRVSALDQLSRLTSETDVVLELSSFQLEGLESVQISPRTSLITNLMADHLNRYPSLEAYFAAKQNIFRYQGADGILALNREDSHSLQLERLAPGYVIWFGKHDHVPGADRSRLRGEHNRANMAGAAAIASVLGVDEHVVEEAITSFRGVPYRQELVREVGGVQFINDTAATTPDATIAALASIERPVVLVAGGADKELTFAGLGEVLAQPATNVRAVVLLEGSATDKLAAVLGNKAHGRFNRFADAIRHAAELARPGDVVLLSPGCASFGMFANEFDRGDQFNEIVRTL